MAQRLKTCVGWLLALLIALFGHHAMAEARLLSLDGAQRFDANPETAVYPAL